MWCTSLKGSEITTIKIAKIVHWRSLIRALASWLDNVLIDSTVYALIIVLTEADPTLQQSHCVCTSLLSCLY